MCFATLGLAISSVITSAESAGPIAYASFLPIAIISGVFDPTFSGLPQWLSRMVAAFPVKALAQVLQGAYTVRPFPAWDLANLALWTAARRRLRRLALPLAHVAAQPGRRLSRATASSQPPGPRPGPCSLSPSTG